MPRTPPSAPQTNTLRTTIYFSQGKSRIDIDHFGNKERIDSILTALGEKQILSIRVEGYSSLEGSTSFNLKISEARAEEAIRFLDSKVRIPSSAIVESEPLGEAWDILRAQVEKSNMEYRDRVLYILYNTPIWVKRGGIIVDGRKRQLRDLKANKAWQYMSEHYFPMMRLAFIELVCAHPELPALESEAKTNDEQALKEQAPKEQFPTQIDSSAIAQPADPIETEFPSKKPFYMTLRSNLLYDIALVPNIGVDFSLGRGWAIGASYLGAWWDKNDYFWRIYGGEVELSKYFGRRAKQKPLNGHHIGLYAQVLSYDFELGARGYLSELSYGAGMSYSYSFPIGKRLSFDCSIGFGYLGGDYKIYDPEDGHYVWKETKSRFWLGPTKAEFAIVWLLGRDNVNVKYRK